MRETLLIIRMADPDGWWFREPRDTDRAAHKAWAIKTYGAAVWAIYCTDWDTATA